MSLDYEDSLNVKLKLDDVIKIKVVKNKKKDPITVDSEGSESIATFSDPEIVHGEKEVEEIYSNASTDDINNIFTGTPEENAKKLHQVDWGNFEIDRIVNALSLIGEKITGMSSLPYQAGFERRVYRAVLTNSSQTITYRVSRQSGKCLKSDTEILMYDGTIKKVQDVEVGDLLMGDDSTPRKVLNTTSGEEDMFEITPTTNYAEPYTVNKSHILTLFDRSKNSRKGCVVDVPLTEVMSMKSKLENSHILGIKTEVEFKRKEQPIDPYFIGLWLGDGTSRETSITTPEPEVENYLHDLANIYSLKLTCRVEKANFKTLQISSGNKNNNPLLKQMKSLNLIGNKHIPYVYKTGDMEQRLQLLAGIIDSDGHISKRPGKENVCDLISVNETLAKDIQWLARSLGYRCSVVKCRKGIKSLKFVGDYFRLNLYGDLSKIPMRVGRKKVTFNPLRNNPNLYGFKITSKGVGKYYGFETDGNHRFLLGDFTITHNSTTIAKVVVTLCTLLPALAKVFPEQLGIYKKGFWVGVFAPVGEQATTLYDRIKDMAHSQEAQMIYEDPDISVEINRKGGCRWDSGSRVYMRSASTKAKIESLSLHMAILDEAQEADRVVVNKSIRPMLAWNNGLMIMAGTSSKEPGVLYEQVQKNMQMDLILPKREQLHFQYIDDDVIKYNPRYKQHCQTQKSEIGEFSPEYQMSYKLKWMFESDKPFTEESIKMHIMRFDREFVRETTRPVVIGIDLASKRMSSVVTAVEIVNVENIYDDDGINKKSICTAIVCDWLEIKETPYPQQRPAMKSFIDRYENIVGIYVDATGAGDPVFSQMKEEWEQYENVLNSFIFSGKGKSDLAKTFDDFFFSDRLVIPSTKMARKSKKWQNFFLQLLHLRTVVKDGYSYYSRNDKIPTSRDDYVDSVMLALHGVVEVLKKAEQGVGEVSNNPYFQKSNPNKRSDFGKTTFPGIEKIREAVRNGTYVPPNQRGMKSTRKQPKIYRK